MAIYLGLHKGTTMCNHGHLLFLDCTFSAITAILLGDQVLQIVRLEPLAGIQARAEAHRAVHFARLRPSRTGVTSQWVWVLLSDFVRIIWKHVHSVCVVYGFAERLLIEQRSFT